MTTTAVGTTGHRLGRTTLRVAAFLLASAILVGPFAAGSVAQQLPTAAQSNPCPDRPGQVSSAGPWLRAKAPNFPIGPQEITTYGLEELPGGLVYVTNGKAVARSSDLGCHWEIVYQLPASADDQQPFSAANSNITMIRTALSGFVYLGIQEGGTAPRAHVMRTINGGNVWLPARGTAFEAAFGQFRDLAVSTFSPGTLYALVDIEKSVSLLEVGAGQVLFGSNDGGTTWDQRTVFSDDTGIGAAGTDITLGSGEVEGLEADPFDPNSIWVFGSAGLFHSTQGGANAVDEGLGGIGEVDVFRPGLGQAATIHAFAREAAQVSRSLDSGNSFTTSSVPGVFDSAGHGGVGDPIAAGAGGRVFLVGTAAGSGAIGAVDISPADGHPIRQVQAAAPFLVMGHTATTIDYRNLLGTPTLPPTPVIPVEIDPGDLKKFGPGNIEPSKNKVTLPQKKTVTKRYELALPPAPTPLDVYFLIDVSGSMSGTINGVRRGMQEIIDRLSAQGIDVHFGVGSYRAFGDPPSYDKVRDIGPVNQELETALNSLQARGGGEETQLFAELRSVTATGGNAPAAQDDPMTFRPNSLKVLINATDEPISVGPPHPSYEDVIAALNIADVKQVGLAIQDPGFGGNQAGANTPAGGLIRVAQGTNTVAPATGVDCDGDGAAEIAPGEPLVCMIAPNRSADAALMADAIVSVLDAVVDINSLDVVAFPAGQSAIAKSPVVRKIFPTTFQGVDLKETSLREFEITYRCPKLDERKIFPVKIEILQGPRDLGSALTTVVCKVPKPEPVPVITAFVPLLALPLPPVRPPDPVPEPNPNPQPNPQGNPQAQAGMASQEQKQPQLAAVHQEAQQLLPEPEEGVSDQFLMTQHQERSKALQPGAVFLTGAVLMTLMYGFATLAREQVRTQTVRRRPWER